MSDIEKINTRINQLQAKQKTSSKRQAYSVENFSYTIAIELLAGVIVGFFLGLFLDNFFKVKPLFIIICTIFGLLGSFKNIMHKLSKKNDS